MSGARKILVVDDEELARLRLIKYFDQAPADFDIKEACDGFQAIDLLQTFTPDIVFLDIEMPEMSGFELLMQIEKRPFALIFQTAYDEFAVKAFEECAVDYLLKPFTDERLAAAIAKAQPKQDSLTALEGKLHAKDQFMERFLVKAGLKQKVVEVEEVVYFASESHVTSIYLASSNFAYDYSLTHLEERLNPQEFIRIHRNAIVKLAEISAIESGATTSVRLKNGVSLPVSRNRKKQLLETMSNQ